MSSPIHKFLFSPPPSPPRPCEKQRAPRPPPLTSLRSILPDSSNTLNLASPTFLNLASPTFLNNELKPRSPRTPQQKHFTLDNAYPASLPSKLKSSEIDLEATPRQTTPRRKIEKTIASPPYLPTNVPSTPLPIPSSLPRPLLRLLFLVSLVVSCVMILIFIPSARLPSLHSASVGRRLALASDGRAYLDVANEVNSWEEEKERDYQPPQIKARSMMKRSVPVDMDMEVQVEKHSAIPPPKASRPALAARPLPASHELLAIQSYLLHSAYNVLPEIIDPAQPPDANVVLGFSGQSLGESGSVAEKAWLEEIEREWEDEVVIWYGGDGSLRQPHEILDILGELHGPSRHPTLIPCHERSDLPLLRSIFDRLSFPLTHHPLVMIGNQPLIGDAKGLEELKNSGKLAEMLGKIGWFKGNGQKHSGEEGQRWKPKLAKMGKKEKSELERALALAVKKQ